MVEAAAVSEHAAPHCAILRRKWKSFMTNEYIKRIKINNKEGGAVCLPEDICLATYADRCISVWLRIDKNRSGATCCRPTRRMRFTTSDTITSSFTARVTH